MSVRLKAKLTDQLSSQVEGSFLRTQDVIRIEGVRAEMQVEVTRAFMEHEAPKHNYLPCFHMMGTIKELHGNFPYNVSSIYFDDNEEVNLNQDIHYYPTPDELAHIIKVGHFYSPDFVVPPILAKNTYMLPCMIDLTIIPPRNEVAYQTAVAKGFENMEEEDKTNLPIFYVGLLGTGVSRKNDKLLDYYGIDLEDGFAQFVLTAESSGYTDPPLLQYMEEPLVAERGEKEDLSEYYISPEEEAELLKLGKEQGEVTREEDMQRTGQMERTDYYEATPEDAIVSQADRRVMRRLEQQMGSKRLTLEAVRASAKEKALEESDEKKQDVDEKEVFDSKEVESASKEQSVDSEKKETGNVNTVKTDKKISDEKVSTGTEEKTDKKVTSDPLKKKEEDEKKAQKKAKDVAVTREQAETGTGNRDRRAEVKKKRDSANQKQDMQESKDIEMDLDSEKNTYIEEQREEEKNKNKEEDENLGTDTYILEKMNAADVSDAKEQEKLNEAQRKEKNRDIAHAVQQVIGEHETAKKSHREVPADMEDITEQYDAEHEATDDEKSDRDLGDD